MAIIGFIALVLILGWITLGVIFSFINPFGDPPSKSAVIGFMIIGVILGYVWYQLFLHAPFTIGMK